MSEFNVLITEVVCPNCGKKNEVRIQFKFGDTYQFKYRIGETLTWGKTDIGIPNLFKVKVYGIIESTRCTYCNRSDLPEEYDIFIDNDVIKRFQPIESLQDYLDGEGEYVVLQK